MPERSPSSRASPEPRSASRIGALLAAGALALGAACSEESGVPPPPPAVIVVQPLDQAVFEGQTALFQVHASGTEGLTYQWLRDGVLIPGATDSHLETGRTVPGDDGTTYSASVTNAGAAPVGSRAARLTVYPPLDLRFQWVGAPYRPSYAMGASDVLVGLTTTWSGTGSPLLIGSGLCAGAWNCAWLFEPDPTVPGMSITYQGGAIQNLGASWASALPSDTVVTSLDLEEASGAYAMSWSRTTQAGEFTPVVQGSVAPDQLQATASLEGASGRVLTAVSFQGGLVSYASYGWSRAGATVYEARVVATTFAAVAADAESLAAEGYVITAFGAGNEAANGLLLVGTRAQGDTTPRLLTVVPDSIGHPPIEGYAIVGYFFDAGAMAFTVIAEQ